MTSHFVKLKIPYSYAISLWWAYYWRSIIYGFLYGLLFLLPPFILMELSSSYILPAILLFPMLFLIECKILQRTFEKRNYTTFDVSIRLPTQEEFSKKIPLSFLIAPAWAVFWREVILGIPVALFLTIIEWRGDIFFSTHLTENWFAVWSSFRIIFGWVVSIAISYWAVKRMYEIRYKNIGFYFHVRPPKASN